MNNKIVTIPSSSAELLERAYKKINQKLYRDAIPLLQKSMDLSNDDAELYTLAECLVRTGQHNRGLGLIFERIIEEQNEIDFYYLSKLYMIIRDPNKSFLFGIYYVQLSGDDNYLEELQKTFEVVFHNEEQVKKESSLFVAQQLFQYLFSRGRINESIDWISNQPLHIQERVEMRNLKAMSYLFVNRYNEAAELLEQLLTEDETDIHALCHYTLLLYNTNDARYLKYLSLLNKLHPIDEDETFKLGIVLSFLEQYESSQKLLLPIYKKRHMQNAQLYHALSYNYFALGQIEQSETMWNLLVELTGEDTMSPSARAQGMIELKECIQPLLIDEDSHVRLLGIFKLSQLKNKEMLITKEMWDQFDVMEDYEKLYLSFIFNQLELVRLKFIHDGLKMLHDVNAGHDELLSWIDKAHQILDSKLQVNGLKSYVAATHYLYNQGRLTKKHCTEIFDTTLYYLNKAIHLFKQNNI